jgi:hypothetical protein
MCEVELLLGEEVFHIPGLALRQVCQTFAVNSLPSRYNVKSNVSIEVFRLFLSGLKGAPIEVTKSNFFGLSTLCSEFGFKLQSPSFRLSEIEVAIEGLRSDIQRLSDDISSLQTQFQISSQHSEAISQLRSDLSVLQRWIGIPQSTILSDFPEIFAEFVGKRFKILWRGSRDGFEPKEFHRRCDGHSNTLTIILDTKGNIFGGFTPLKWDSSNSWKADESQKSFLFTLKNSHNFPAKKFGLKDRRSNAICCYPTIGPHFYDIGIQDRCFATSFGNSYINDTGLDGKTFFTGSQYFEVKEIEVFEITN